jgi:DNA-3-methyladenine glycosylase II
VVAKTALKRALAHLGRDPKMGKLIERVGREPPPPSAAGTHFAALARAIVYQQLSGKAAATILGRVVAAAGGTLGPEAIAALSDDALRAAGLSKQKLGYLRDLSAKSISGELPVELLHELSDDEIVSAARAVKGIGLWTAQMFLMFRLGRPDVLPVHDLGIRKGVQKLFRLRTLPAPEKIETLAEPWRPYRTVACWYLWRLTEMPTRVVR